MTTTMEKASMLADKRRGRPSAQVAGLLPHGVKDLGVFPRRREFADGEMGAKQHRVVMKEYKAKLGSAQAQDNNYQKKIRQVAHFGEFLVANKYGKFLDISKSKDGGAILVAKKKDGTVLMPPWESVAEYMLVQVSVL